LHECGQMVVDVLVRQNVAVLDCIDSKLVLSEFVVSESFVVVEGRAVEFGFADVCDFTFVLLGFVLKGGDGPEDAFDIDSVFFGHSDALFTPDFESIHFVLKFLDAPHNFLPLVVDCGHVVVFEANHSFLGFKSFFLEVLNKFRTVFAVVSELVDLSADAVEFGLDCTHVVRILVGEEFKRGFDCEDLVVQHVLLGRLGVGTVQQKLHLPDPLVEVSQFRLHILYLFSVVIRSIYNGFQHVSYYQSDSGFEIKPVQFVVTFGLYF